MDGISNVSQDIFFFLSNLLIRIGFEDYLILSYVTNLYNPIDFELLRLGRINFLFNIYLSKREFNQILGKGNQRVNNTLSSNRNHSKWVWHKKRKKDFILKKKSMRFSSTWCLIDYPLRIKNSATFGKLNTFKRLYF